MMASNRVRFDVVALLVMIALIVTGILSVPQALSGFAQGLGYAFASLGPLFVGIVHEATGGWRFQPRV